MLRISVTLVAFVLLTGCVAQDKYGALKLEKDRALEQMQQAQTAEAAARASEAAWKQQYDNLLANSGEAGKLAAKYGEENALLRSELATVNERYKRAMEDRVSFQLPPTLQRDLAALAEANPVIEFDAARGIVKFKGDVTFAKGSADLTPQAKQAIRTFAQILNSNDARDYEFLVAGHTDSTPVSNPETKRRHPDNWYLSTHRAISVGSELMSQGVSPRRLGCVGYADQRPVASNGTSEGQARNRRVEVLLLPTTLQGNGSTVAGAVTPQPAATGQRSAPAATADLNKDSATVDPRPVLNK